MILISNGQKYAEVSYRLESELEKDVVYLAASIFGADTIYIDAKRKMHEERKQIEEKARILGE